MIVASSPSASVPVAPLDLARPRRVHVVGVGGPGMSAIALALAEMGHDVSGVDIRDRPVIDRLRAAGVTVHYLFAAVGQIPRERPELREMVRFGVDYTLFLNLAFLGVAAVLLWLWLRGRRSGGAGEAVAPGRR